MDEPGRVGVRSSAFRRFWLAPGPAEAGTPPAGKPMMPVANGSCTMVVETVYGTRRTATKDGDRKGRVKRPTEPIPL